MDRLDNARARDSRDRKLRVSIVCFAIDAGLLRNTIATLLVACSNAIHLGYLRSVELLLVDNGPTPNDSARIVEFVAAFAQPDSSSICLRICGDGQNIGFGAGHNLAFDPQSVEYHLVLNPDVELAADSLVTALAFLDEHMDCGIVVPAFANRNGEPEYLCKRYPTVFDLLLRGFAPSWLRERFGMRLACYEMRDIGTQDIFWQPPLVSGCFMLIRASVLADLKGFDPKYFLYFEDFDLSLRARKLTKVVYVSAVRVTHFGGYAAQKGWRHIYLFVRSAIIFFNRHGWRWC